MLDTLWVVSTLGFRYDWVAVTRKCGRCPSESSLSSSSIFDEIEQHLPYGSFRLVTSCLSVSLPLCVHLRPSSNLLLASRYLRQWFAFITSIFCYQNFFQTVSSVFCSIDWAGSTVSVSSWLCQCSICSLLALFVLIKFHESYKMVKIHAQFSYYIINIQLSVICLKV